MPALTLLFDVYGTLVDPAGMAGALATDVGEGAAAFAQLWRDKQIEYSFRRALMANYAPFTRCTEDALAFCCRQFGVDIGAERRAALMALYRRLPAFGDAAPALAAVRAAGHRPFAFSNGPAADVEAVLVNAGLRDHFAGVISVDAVKTFKPAPAVYAYARRASGAWSAPCWLVSGNAWDVIGARSAGLDAAWVRRSADRLFDPWGIEPTLVVPALTDLAPALAAGD
jgi:2-haloacid dehalogenase